MKRGRLPLTALRSFESAGRHRSFSRAAEELFVSQAAISRQIRELETTLKTPLFVRLHRKVELTEAGARLLDQLTKSFDAIENTLEEFSPRAADNSVRLSVDPAVASCWLVPRLNRFRALHPDIELVIDVETRIIDFGNHDADLGLRFAYRATSWPDTEAERLAPGVETPMLTPSLLAAGSALDEPDDLRSYTLLHEENRQYWEDWFKAAGADEKPLPARRGPLLDDPALTRQAALLDHGAMLGDLLLMHDDLMAGRLVMPFASRITIGAYWIAARRFDELSDAARSVVAWIRDEVAICVADLGI